MKSETRRADAFLLSGLLLVLACSLSLTAPGGGPPTSGRSPAKTEITKRALVVAIAEYAPDTGWGQLHADHDLPLIRTALAEQNFDAVYELIDGDATRTGLVRAFREQLIEASRPGDLAVFHFSGHGQQLTDDSGEELDGYDEALVPYDAPSSLAGDYRGEKHLRDDTFHLLTQELRRKVGPTGHVVAFLDSCFSGTPRGVLTLTRGRSTAEIAIRGGPPLGAPANRSLSRETGGGFLEPPMTASTRGSSDLAPYVVFSAARHDQYAHETMGDEGFLVGSLTYAVTRELATAGSDATYRWLHERMRWLMARRVMNEPQVEGDIDALLFNGQAVAQDPFVAIDKVDAAGARVTLAAGSLAGLQTGARIEIHVEGTLRSSDASRIVAGTVATSTPTAATIDLDTATDPTSLERARAFITRPTFGGQPLRVQITVSSADLDRRLWSTLEESLSGIERVTAEPDVLIFSTPRGDSYVVAAETSRDRLALLPAVPVSTPDLEQRLARRLVDYARNRALRGLDLSDPEFPISFELLPMVANGPLDPTDKLSPSNPSTWHIGDLFRFRVANSGQYPAHLNVLDLPADGTVRMLWPEPHTGDPTPLPAGVTMTLPILYEIDEPTGSEVIVLIASREPLNMRPLLTGSPTRGDGASNRDSLNTALASGLTSSAILITVEPRDTPSSSQHPNGRKTPFN